MPTGYTSEIEKGISFNEYAMNCAKAFAACITMKDAPHDEEIPEDFKVSDYHQKSINETTEELYELDHHTSAGIVKLTNKEYEDKIEHNKNGIKKALELKEKYESMWAKVYAWTPPSPDHVKYKEFMLDQLTQSIEWDCNIDYYNDINITRRTDTANWLAEKKQALKERIVYSAKKLKEEQSRVNGRNIWMKQLRNSLEESK